MPDQSNVPTHAIDIANGARYSNDADANGNKVGDNGSDQYASIEQSKLDLKSDDSISVASDDASNDLVDPFLLLDNDGDTIIQPYQPVQHPPPLKNKFMARKMVLSGHTASVSGLRYSPNGKWLLSCSADRTICLWRADGTHTRTFRGHMLGICDISWSSDSQYFCSGSDDTTIRIWSIGSSDAGRVLEGHAAAVFCVHFNPHSNLIVSGSFDESLKIWDVKQGVCLRTLPAHSDPVSAVCFNRDGTLIVSSGYDGLIRIWDTATGLCLKTLIDDNNPAVSVVQFSPNGKYILASTFDSSIRLWDFASGKCLKIFSGHKNEKYCCASSFLVGKQAIVTGSEDGHIYIYDLQTKKILEKIYAAESEFSILSVACHPTSIMMASSACEYSGEIQIWEEKENE